MQPRENDFFPLLALAVVALAPRLLLVAFGPDLYADEASIGYDAYSILETGRDFHGNPYPLFFESFGEYKNPVYIYATVPFVAAFGPTQLAVRAPSFVFGLLAVIATYFLGKRLFGRQAGFAAGALAALSPWMLHSSLLAFEASLVPFFTACCALAFVKFVQDGGYANAVLCGLVFGASFFVYGVMRLFAPLLAIGLLVAYRDSLAGRKREAAALVVAACLVLSIGGFYYLNHGPAFMKRFNEVSAFNAYGEEAPSRIAGRYVEYLSSMKFYLFDGDQNRRHSPHALFFVFEFVLALGGGAYAALGGKSGRRWLPLFAVWLALFPLAASLTEGAPDAIRVLTLLPLPYLLAGFALSKLWNHRASGAVRATLAALAFLSLSQAPSFYYYYLAGSPGGYVDSEQWWFDYGVQESLQHAKSMGGEGAAVVVSDTINPLSAAFWLQIPPARYQEGDFGRFSRKQLSSLMPRKGVVYVSRGDELRQWPAVFEARYSNGEPAYKVVYAS